MILILSKSVIKFHENDENAGILRLIKISKNCHGRFTANYQQFLASRSILRKKCGKFYTHLLTDLKDLSPMLSNELARLQKRIAKNYVCLSQKESYHLEFFSLQLPCHFLILF